MRIIDLILQKIGLKKKNPMKQIMVRFLKEYNKNQKNKIFPYNNFISHHSTSQLPTPLEFASANFIGNFKQFYVTHIFNQFLIKHKIVFAYYSYFSFTVYLNIQFKGLAENEKNYAEFFKQYENAIKHEISRKLRWGGVQDMLSHLQYSRYSNLTYEDVTALKAKWGKIIKNDPILKWMGE